MKNLKFAFALLCVIAPVAIAMAWVEPSYDFRVDDVLYRITSSENKTVEICGFDFPSEIPLTKDINIPPFVSNDGISYKVVGTGNLVLVNDHSDPEVVDDEPWITQFYNWRYPAHLTFPYTIEYLNDGAFSECDRLESVYFNNCPLETIPASAFSLTTNLTKVHLPDNLKAIDNYAFYGCGIEEITLPDGLESIGDFAFSGGGQSYWCDMLVPISTFSFLKEIIIPNSVKKLGISSYYTPYKAEQIVLSNSLKDIPDNNFEQPLKTKEIIIPNSVVSIGNNCFSTTSEFTTKHEFEGSVLESLTLGKNLKTIGEGSFGEIPNLKTLYCLSDNPPTFVFDKANPDAIVYVPKNKISIYQKDPLWGKHFKNFIELPDILIQFQMKNYTMKTGDILTLRYIVSLFNYNLTFSEEWSSSLPDGLVVENGVAHAYKSGEYVVKYVIKDSMNNTYEASCNINVEQGSGIIQVPNDIENDNDIDFAQEYSLYNLNGLFLNSDIKNIPHGVYIIKQNTKLKKIVI